MTTFGKILVFLNLVFALLTGGLIGMAFLTRTNWKAAYDDIQGRVQTNEAAYQQLISDESKKTAFQIQQADTAKKNAEAALNQVATAKAEIDRLNALLTATKRTNDNESETTKSMTVELNRRRDEVRQLNDVLVKRDDRLRDLEKQLTETRDESVSWKLKYDSLREKNSVALSQIEEMSRELGGLRARGVVTAGASDKRPPADQVRGTVKAVDGNLATVSVGTDAGVNKDNILYIYRLSPQPEYIGKLTILSATPFEAVGRIELVRRQAVVRVGDEVASKITIQK